MKSDGFPTYHLANVVDDHLMNISHVLRGVVSVKTDFYVLTLVYVPLNNIVLHKHQKHCSG